ncbi:unnamed protein product [Strongylus vulgaris]|uniref:Uncharacterized protein n=1 Tax=Strongylus vulgaris TaxID=40348 RepID=A0A3P7JQA3_STRVU|nr:unnamed protein product [Strongylus vulgaris]
MDPWKADGECDYDDTSETTLSLYSLAPTESFVDSEDLGSFENSCCSDMDFDYNKNLWDAMSYISADTALSEISIYSQYTPPPSETNVEIEWLSNLTKFTMSNNSVIADFVDDIIAGASPMSTAVVQPPLYVGGTRVVDSLECIHKLSEAKVLPVEDFGNPNVTYLCSGDLGEMKTPSEIEEEQYEYSYYSDGPSETNVSMEGVEIFGDHNEADYKNVSQMQDAESLPVG